MTTAAQTPIKLLETEYEREMAALKDEAFGRGWRYGYDRGEQAGLQTAVA